MKISERFKKSTQNTIDENERKKYALGIYKIKDYEDRNLKYVDARESCESDETDYESRISLLIDRLILLHYNSEFQHLKDIFKGVMHGESRQILDGIRKSIESICYILDNDLLKNKSSFSLALENINLNVCIPGVFTHMQNILYSMRDDLYEIKYKYISDIALQYAKEKMQYNDEIETHVVNMLIHEVHDIYCLTPIQDYFAFYRDLNEEPDDEYIIFYQFREYLDNHFNSKESINTLLDHYLDNFIYLFKSNDINSLNNFCSDANISIYDLIEEDLDTLKLKDTGLDLARILLVKKLIREDVISYAPIKFQNGDELLEFPDAWYLLSGYNNVKKILDTSYFPGFKINGKELEVHLSSKLRSRSFNNWGNFLDSIISNQNYLELDVILLTDQCKALLEDEKRESILHIATLYGSKQGDLKFLKYLLDIKYLDVDIKDVAGNTPLHWVAAQGALDVVKMLIDAGANINSLENNGNTPLHIALQNNNYDIAEYILTSGAKVHTENKLGKYPVFDVINNFFYRNDEKISLLNLIINANDFDATVKDQDGLNPLEYACKNRIMGIIPTFFNKGFDVTNCLYSALKYNDRDMFNIIFSCLDNIDEIRDKNGFTPLHYVSISGKFHYMEDIISKMRDLSAVDNSGETALHSIVYATITFDKEMVIDGIKLMIEKDPSIINIQNKNGDTPLHLMIRSGFTEAAKILIAQPNLEMKMSNSVTGYLKLAFASKNIEVIKAFLNSSHDISEDMQTILNWSVAFLWDAPVWGIMQDLNSLDNILDKRTKMFNKIFNNIDPISKCIFMYMINSEDRSAIIQYNMANIKSFVEETVLDVVEYLHHNAAERRLAR